MQNLFYVLIELVFVCLLQSFAFLIGMHAVARKRIEKKPFLTVMLLFLIFTVIVRNCGLFTFGVHTMLVLLEASVTCVLICKTDIKYTVLGAILMVIFVVVGELIDLGVLTLLYPTRETAELLQDPLIRSLSALPGNILNLITACILYYLRIGRKQYKNRHVSE